jgi:tRNA (cmo5U34)-methyltransferase
MATAEEFYDSFSSQYTEAIKRCVPRYEEMLRLLLRYIPSTFAPRRILELGCGTGNLTAMIAHKYPDSTLVAVDFSGETLAECKRRLNNPLITFLQEHFETLSFAKSSFDLVISSISIHHLSDTDKNRLFHNVFQWLTDDGIFTFADQFRGETDEAYQRHIDLWKAHGIEHAVSDEEWEMWMEHQRAHDHHATIREHLSWLEQCRFEVADCVWRYSLWAILDARK